MEGQKSTEALHPAAPEGRELKLQVVVDQSCFGCQEARVIAQLLRERVPGLEVELVAAFVCARPGVVSFAAVFFVFRSSGSVFVAADFGVGAPGCEVLVVGVEDDVDGLAGWDVSGGGLCATMELMTSRGQHDDCRRHPC